MPEAARQTEQIKSDEPGRDQAIENASETKQILTSATVNVGLNQTDKRRSVGTPWGLKGSALSDVLQIQTNTAKSALAPSR